MVKASDLLVESLAAEGVEYVFGVPGEELEELLFSIRDSEITYVPTRHEQGAAFMADVHGRLTGEAGVCLSTLGPGATNLITGVADAHLDKSPLVAITGQGGRERLHKESHQALDIVQTFEQVVKWNTQLSEPEIVAESVRKAFKLAEYEKPGATHLEFPEDVAAEETTDTPLPARDRVRRPDPDPDSVERMATLLERAERPMVLAGNGAVRTRSGAGSGHTSESANQLRELVSRMGLPVVATYMGKGAISDREPYSLLTLDSGANGEAGETIEEADCVLAVGYDIAEHDPAGWNPDLDTTVLHVDHEPAEVYRHYNPEVEIVADIPASLQAITEAVSPGSGKAWCTDVHDRLIEDVTERPDEDDAFSVSRTLPILREVMADEDVLLSDVGSHKMAIAQEFPVYEPNTCIISNGLASMGIAVPGGLAADLACESNVVAATGDGGFLMNAAEIETATRLGLGFTILLFNDNDYGLITDQQEEHLGEHFGTKLENPDFVTFAESFGISGYRPETWAELEAVLEAVVPSEEMSLVEVVVE